MAGRHDAGAHGAVEGGDGHGYRWLGSRPITAGEMVPALPHQIAEVFTDAAVPLGTSAADAQIPNG